MLQEFYLKVFFVNLAYVMALSQVKQTGIVKVSPSGAAPSVDLLAVEDPMEIRLGFGPEGERQQKSISVTMRTPGYDFELALGFLYTENIISAYDQVQVIRYCSDGGRSDEEKENVVRVELHPEVVIDFNKIERHFYTSSSCGVCSKTSIEAVRTGCRGVESGFVVSEEVIHLAPGRLRDAQRVFEYTGGLHAAGLFDANGNLLMMREDIGRHNAVDKLVGAQLVSRKLPLSDCFILVSGRAGFELVQKSLMAGIPLMAAIGAPSSLALSLAEEFGMTLIGFARNGGFNLYSGRERVKLAER